jgi:hypothetical protein
LVDNDNHWIQYFEEGVTFLHGARLRNLFIIALTHGDIVDLKGLWERFREGLSDDLPSRFREFNSIPDIDLPEQDYALHLIE